MVEIGQVGPRGGHNPPRRAGRGLARPGVSCPAWPPSPLVFGSNNTYLFRNNSPKSFVPFRELLFLHKNNTMVVLLKTASVRVSSIQIMQIRVQNKGKRVRNTRYVATPPSLTHCLFSSNSIDKLKVTKKTFTDSFVLVVCIYT